MGSQLKARCRCGLAAKILTGGNMKNFTEIDYFPFYCGRCRNVVQSNLMEKRPICPKCSSDKIIPYNDSKLKERSWKSIFIKSYRDTITKGLYKCPRCRKIALQFFHGDVLWD